MRLIKGIILALLILLLFAVVNYLHVTANYQLPTIRLSYWDPFSSFTLATFLPSIIFFLVWFIYIKNQQIRSLFLEFLFPLSIAIYTVITGSIGFHELGMGFSNSIFSAANLLTLNSSIFEYQNENGQIQNITLWLINARIIGAFFLMYAFFLALSIATGKENINRLAFWIYRHLGRKNYNVIIGDSSNAIALALDHEKQGQKAVLLYNGDETKLKNIADKKAIFFMTGSGRSVEALEKTYFQKAEKVFVINELEDDNFRVCQTMIKSNLEHTYKKQNWFVQIQEPRKRTLLSELSKSKENISLGLFDIHQNIARDITLTNDTKSINDPTIKIYENIVFGFNKLSEAIILQLLGIGHFSNGKYVHIMVYYESKDKDSVQLFKSKHPELFFNQEDKQQWASLKNYTFLSNGPILEFAQLPESESQLLHPDFDMYHRLRKHSAINIYVCMSNGIESASMLTSILPRLNQASPKYLKSYFYYDSIEESEKKLLESKLCKITQNRIPVSCFGSSTTNYTIDSIEKKERDLLAKYIGYLYVKIYSQMEADPSIIETSTATDKNLSVFDKIKNGIAKWDLNEIQANWTNISEIDKESNRHAADQSIIKLALLGIEMDKINELNQTTYHEQLDVLAEVEHRRWNAEKLLLGWLPTAKELTEEVWLKNKNELRKQKFHYHLTDYHSLPVAEKSKDYTQILGLPYFINSILSKVRN